MRIRARLRLRNEAMLAARERLGLSQPVVDDRAGVAAHTTLRFETMDLRGTPETILMKAAKVASVLGLSVEDVCPSELLGLKVESRHDRVIEAEPARLAILSRNFEERLTLPSPEDAVETRDEVEKLLACLTPMQRGAIEEEFLGIEDESGASRMRGAREQRVKTALTRIRARFGVDAE